MINHQQFYSCKCFTY